MEKNVDVTEKKNVVKNDKTIPKVNNELNISGRFSFRLPTDIIKSYGFTYYDYVLNDNGQQLYLRCSKSPYELVNSLMKVLKEKNYFTFAQVRKIIEEINYNSKSTLDGVNCETMSKLNIIVLSGKLDVKKQKLYSLNPSMTLDEIIQLTLAYRLLKKHINNFNDCTYVKPLPKPVQELIPIPEIIIKPVEVVETVLKPNKQLDLGLFDKRTIVNNNSSLINIALDHLNLLKEKKSRIENESKITDLNAKKDILSSTLEHTRKNLELAQSKNSLAEKEYNEFIISYNNHVDEYPDAYLAIIDIDNKIKEASRIISQYYNDHKNI